jgi:TPP-dependent pyruvate/acetoin dehydrogenase alpha subunit
MTYAELLGDNDLLQMYRWLVRIRAFEDRVCDSWRLGKLVEPPHGSQGQEAIAVGACYGLQSGDWVLPSLRTRGAFFLRGVSARKQMAAMHARVTGAAKGKATGHHMGDPKHGVLLGSGLVGSSITVAVGAALALKLQKKDAIVVDFFGDGAAQRGDFHEGLNFAGVMRLPIVFVLENNQYAEMTPLAKHFAGSELAVRAEGYGFPGVRIDGNDVFAVYETVQAAAIRARGGEGPTLIECLTYRYRGHSETGVWIDTRDRAEIDAWRAKDPIPRMALKLIERGVLSDNLGRAIDAEAQEEVDDAVDFALASPAPGLDEITADVYAPDNNEIVTGRRS